MTLKPGAPTSESLFENVEWTRTKAYAIGLNGIYLNLVDRERLGIVREDQAAALKQQLIEDLAGFKDSESGDPVVSKAWAAEEIYQGAETDEAPDLVIGYREGCRASWQTALGGVPAALIEDNDRNWSGDHCVDPALVPGVLFTSFDLDQEVRSISEVPALIARTFRPSGRDPHDAQNAGMDRPGRARPHGGPCPDSTLPTPSGSTFSR